MRSRFFWLALFPLAGWFLWPSEPTPSDLPSVGVTHGLFRVTIVESGEVEATRSMTVSSPRVGDWGSRPQITWLAPEGSQVESGDILARFDPSGLEKAIFQQKSEVQIKQAVQTRTQASQTAVLAALEAQLSNSEASFELAELEKRQLAFESEVQRRQGELRFTQASNSLAQARQKIESQRIIDSEELRRIEIEIQQAQAGLEKAREDMASLEVAAPAAGLIVYQTNWGNGKKFQVGDTPWPGQPIIGLPDLSEMQVATQVNEVDVSKVSPGQKVEVRLDAFPDLAYPGHVADVATLGRKKSENSEVNVFRVQVRIDTTSNLLKPGMSASCEIEISRVDGALSIPLDAVFGDQDAPEVFRLQGRDWKARIVSLGHRSTDAVVVTSGLDAHDRILLFDPTDPTDFRGERLEDLMRTAEALDRSAGPTPRNDRGTD